MNQKLREELDRRIQTGRLATDVDLHVHTDFSDGGCTAEDMVTSAIRRGIRILGFSDHSVLPGECWCMTDEEEERYRETVAELKDRYRDVIDIYCGIEQDALSGVADTYYDYVIGSSHSVHAGDNVVWVDSAAKDVVESVRKYYNGDYYAYAEAYYEGIGNVYESTGCDIVGHFDLVTKFNEGNVLFDTSNPQYINAWRKAADRLCGRNLIFEINTGGIARGYRSVPYPEEEIVAYLRHKGEKVILSSDSHDTATIAFEFEKYRNY